MDRSLSDETHGVDRNSELKQQRMGRQRVSTKLKVTSPHHRTHLPTRPPKQPALGSGQSRQQKKKKAGEKPQQHSDNVQSQTTNDG